MPTEKPQTQAQRLRNLEARMAAFEESFERDRAMNDETLALVRTLVDALMKPQPGHARSLLDRVAAVTIKVERGEWSMRVLLGLAAGAISLSSAIVAVRHWLAN